MAKRDDSTRAADRFSRRRPDLSIGVAGKRAEAATLGDALAGGGTIGSNEGCESTKSARLTLRRAEATQVLEKGRFGRRV